MTKIRKVIVLGCGPSGLLAAHAAVQSGREVVILSAKEMSKIGGAQYIHKPIPGITLPDPDGEAVYIYKGTKAGYAEKVYNDPKAPVSWGKYRGVLGIWNMRSLYGDLWDYYHHLIQHRVLLARDVLHLDVDSSTMVLSTIPLTSMCSQTDEHAFYGQRVWIEYEQFRPETNYIIYNGAGDDLWYRRSHLFSWRSVEYPDSPAVREFLSGRKVKAVLVNKPLSSTCTCLPKVVRLGRYGKWIKEALAHDAYFGALEALRVAEEEG